MNGRSVAVLGAGHMGSALLRGLVKAKGADPKRLHATLPRAERAANLGRELGVAASSDNRIAAQGAEIIILAVKPQILRKVLDEIRDVVDPSKLVISIAAGVATESLEATLGEGVPVVRAMPNVAVTVDAGATAICRGAHATPEHLQDARSIFETVGLVVEVDEYLMDAVTGLSGTGPMYIFQILEALSDAGVKVGLSRRVATDLAVQTVLGAGRMARETGLHPGVLKDMVTSPGGTAIAALHSMERSGLRASLIDAVEVATKRSQELGELARKAGGQPKAR
ncbi:MAG: pyrroline-5-carboxylate reductase [Thermoplasmatota archaeon]